MNRVAALALLAGASLATALVASEGVASIWHSIARLGLSGFGLVLAFHTALIVLMGLAWAVLGRGRRDVTAPRLIWGRWVRDGASEALPFSQLGGFAIGARAAALSGVGGAFATASTVVDVTLELFAQLAYTLLGAALLAWLRPGAPFLLPALGGTVVMLALACVFAAVQGRGAGLAEHASRRLAARFIGGAAATSAGVQTEIGALHARPRRLTAGTALHLACWVLSGVETWITWRLMGVPVSLPAALAIDSLLYGLRSIAFLVPGALGVQEGGFVALGALFGVAAAPALALSLIKRARDLALGVPVLLIWQGWEARRAIRGPRLPAAAALRPAP